MYMNTNSHRKLLEEEKKDENTPKITSWSAGSCFIDRNSRLCFGLQKPEIFRKIDQESFNGLGPRSVR